MAKVHFSPYTSKQVALFPQRINEDIAEDGLVRIIAAVLDGISLTRIYDLYNPESRYPFHPLMVPRRSSMAT